MLSDLGPDSWTTRVVFQRLLAFVYLLGFVVIVNQFLPLCGEKGLEPVFLFLEQVRFWAAPSLFWIDSSDHFLMALGWLGVIFSLVAVSGLSEAFGMSLSLIVWGSLWLLYLSFVNVGQIFYAFGWEILLLEAGFLCIFFGSRDTKVPVIIIWLLRWLLFRLMFGAGLIKIRGDDCWWDLSCMIYHYETQPLPNPLSWYFHHLPVPLHKASVLFNHFTELIVPFGYFFRGRVGAVAGGTTILFQLLLIISGNFSWLNWLTIVLCVACFSDHHLRFLRLRPPPELYAYKAHEFAVYGLSALVLLLSIAPTVNLFSPHQHMNASFEPFHLVNTYGAFGSITKVRREIVIEGIAEPISTSGWQEYEFKAKPGDTHRIPPIIAPYHLRLDWLMWFAPFSSCQRNPWFLNFLEKLLAGDKDVIGLLQYNPFAESPPILIRTTLYEYHFTSSSEKKQTGAIWKRTQLGLYCPMITGVENRE